MKLIKVELPVICNDCGKEEKGFGIELTHLTRKIFMCDTCLADLKKRIGWYFY